MSCLHLSRRPLMLALAAGLGLPAAQAADATRWVHGSWVNVRATAAADGAVTAHITTNTEVQLVSQQGNACEITWGTEARGFIACKMLGEDKVRLDEVAVPTLAGDKPNPKYSPLRAFWLAPSADAFYNAGQYFQRTLLSQAQRDAEQGESDHKPKLVRYAVPEFDAMKALLAGGIVSARQAALPAIVSQCGAAGRGKRPAANQDANWACYTPALPKVAPSYIKQKNQVLFGSADVDLLSSHFGIKEFGKVAGGPKWDQMRSEGYHYTGVWDVGSYQLKLAQPMVEHVIGRTGLMGALAWTPSQTTAPLELVSTCNGSDRLRAEGGKPLADYPKVSDELLHFQVLEALPFRHAKITVSSRKLKPSDDAPDVVKPTSVNEYLIDLDGDGVPDILQAEGTASVPDYGSLVVSKTYANIAGVWTLVDQRQDMECT